MNPEGQQEYWRAQGDDAGEAPLQNTVVEPPATTVEDPALHSDDVAISWQASEYIHHEKHAMWFMGLIGGTVILLAISFFLIRSLTFSILLIVMAVSVMVMASRPPRVLRYQLDHYSLTINEKHFALHDFRAFGLIQEGPFYSITLIPHKRFMPAVNVYFPPEEGERIVDVFGASLPMEQVEPDILDKLVRKLRF